MRSFLSLLFVVVILHGSYAPPVSPDKSKEQDSDVKDDLEDYMEYHRYLREVVQALESDPEFRERLEKADEEDIRSGKIAEQLDFVNHNVRTQLDEIKRREMERLRHLATKQYELTNHLDAEIEGPDQQHLDHENPHTFEIEDLKKLIKKTTANLEEADKKRKQEFKEYEMQKEFEKHQNLENMDETQKKEFQEKLDHEEKAKKQHEPLHHPITKDQLMELWKKADDLEAKDFNPRVFFMMHDVDGNGVWDADEVKALFIKELDKMYGPGGPNKDLHERSEEMERMREHVFQESDSNRDGLIDFKEFIDQTKRTEFQHDQGWKPIDENQIYTQSEYQEFERRRLEELRFLQQRGLVDSHGNAIPGSQHQIKQALHEQHQLAYQQQMQQQQYHGQPPAQYHPQQVPPFEPHGRYPVGPAPQGQANFQGQAQYAQGQAQYPQQMPQGQGHPQQGQGHYPTGPKPKVQGQQAQAQVQNPQQVPQAQGQPQQAQGQYSGQQQQVPLQGIPGQQYVPPQGQMAGQHPAQQNVPPQGQMVGQHPAQQNVPPQGQMVGQNSAQNNAAPQGQMAGQNAAQQNAPPQAQMAGQNAAQHNAPPHGQIGQEA